MAFSQEELLTQLNTLKSKDRPYFDPAEYKSFMPAAIPGVNKSPDRTIFNAQMQSITDRSNTATLTEEIKRRNENEYQQMREAQQAVARAQSSLRSARNIRPQIINGQPYGKRSITITSGGNVAGTGKVGKISPLRGAGVSQNLGTFDWNGKRAGGKLTLNRSVGNRFVGFLQALSKTGYKIGSVGTYANRNIAGSSTKSLHAYGLAMDINPASNPVSYGHVVTNLPKGVGRLAAKYGLVWGGNWNGPKYDAMHFSVPYGGRK